MRIIIKTVAVLCVTTAVATSAFAHKSRQELKGEHVDWKDVPQAAQTAIENSATGAKVKEIAKEVKNGTTIYTAEVKGKDGNYSKVAVTAEGKVLNVKPDTRAKHKHRALFG